MHIDKHTRALIAERMREVHYWVGLTLNAAQGLEYGCKLLLFILAEQKLIDYSIRDAHALMEGELKKTFGQVFKTLRRFIRLDAQQEESFLQALERRNWFIHEFYHARAESLIDALGRDESVRELKALRKQFMASDAIMKPIIQQLMLRFYNKDVDEFSQEAIDRIISDAKPYQEKA